MPKCMVCGKMYRMITPTHLKKHNITIAQYREKFPNSDISEKDIRSEKVRRESSKRMSVVSKRNWADPELRERIIKSSVDARSTPEFHELRSQITREYHEQHPGEASRMAKIAWEDPAYRERQQELGKARWEDPEYREHITECLRRRADDPEYVEKMRIIGERNWEIPGYREKVVAGIKQSWESPGYREKQSADAKERWKDPAYRDNISKAITKLWQDPDYRERGLKLLANAYKNRRDEPTDIEIILCGILDIIGVPYETQVCIDRYTVDALVCDSMVIEADGVYWHSFPKVIEKDNRKNEFLSTQGYDVLRLSGELLRNQPGTCFGTIVGFMEAC